jgi:nitrogen fixation/metabolism regulation signal transduction histidine kinase
VTLLALTMPTESPAVIERRLRAGMPSFERRVLLGGGLIALPALIGMVAAVVVGIPDQAVRWLLVTAIAAATVIIARWQCRRVVYPLYTLVGLLEALREGDYSLRGVQGSVLHHAIYDVNLLAERLQRERLTFEESSSLVRKTLAALDSAVFVFDHESRLRLFNPAAQHLLGNGLQTPTGRRASALGLEPLLEMQSTRVINYAFPSRSGRFDIRNMPLRHNGRSSQLLVINDVGRVLREEERQAWQRLLRVLSHEVNNSLASIHSLAGTLAKLIAQEPLADDWREDSRSGLEVIGNRAESLARFLTGYSRLAALPPPQRRELDLAELVRTVVRLEQRAVVQVEPGAPVRVRADPDQFEQALINLVHNAVEASLVTGGEVVMRWRVEGDRALIEILDQGHGLPSSDNLFVPFFTTKPGGSGIGLALVRQIAEAHDGGVSLLARDDAPGAIAQLWLPLEPPSSQRL